MSNPDFVSLARAAYPDIAPAPREAMDDLWAAAFSLPAWHFLMTPASAPSPSVQSIDGKGWMLVFTDSDLLFRYASGNKNLDANGHALFLTMEPAKALSFLAGARRPELFGVRFNEAAERGWFSPLDNLPRIRAHLVRQGRVKPG